MQEPLAHWDAAIERFCFAKFAESSASPEVLARTEPAVAFLCTDLHIPRPKIVWMRPAAAATAAAKLGRNALDIMLEERDPDFTRYRSDILEGCTPLRPDLHEVWIRSELNNWPDLECVVLHELRYAWQKLHLYEEIFRDECRAEGDAYPYGYEALIRFLESQRKLTTEVRDQIDAIRRRKEVNFRTRWPHGRFEILPESHPKPVRTTRLPRAE
jgi:hypothetical protein